MYYFVFKMSSTISSKQWLNKVVWASFFSSERNLSVEKYWVQKLLEGVKENLLWEKNITTKKKIYEMAAKRLN